jgi:serine/threonine-protein kinase
MLAGLERQTVVHALHRDLLTPRSPWPLRITGPLARGGMAELFLARDDRGTRWVIKRSRRGEEESQSSWRLIHEGALLTRIRHPNVIRCAGLGRASIDGGSVAYLILEWIDGADLARILTALARSERRLSPPAAALLAEQVALGLEAVHQAQAPDGEPLEAIHADLTPANLLIDRQGRLRVADLGVARSILDSRSRACSGLIGTLAYFAPERCQKRRFDRRADLWSLGAIFFELLSGASLIPPHRIHGAVEAIVTGDAARDAADRRIPPSLRPILRGLLERDPARRFSSAAQVARRLATWRLRTAPSYDTAQLATELAPLWSKTPPRQADDLPTAPLSLERSWS